MTNPDEEATGKYVYRIKAKKPLILQFVEEGVEVFYTFSYDKKESTIHMRKYNTEGKSLFTNKIAVKEQSSYKMYFNESIGVITILLGTNTIFNEAREVLCYDTNLQEINVSNDREMVVDAVDYDMQHYDLMNYRTKYLWYREKDAIVVSKDRSQLNGSEDDHTSYKLRRFVPNSKVVTALESSYRALWVFNFESMEKKIGLIGPVPQIKPLGIIESTIVLKVTYTAGYKRYEFIYMINVEDGNLVDFFQLDLELMFDKYYCDGEKLLVVGAYKDGRDRWDTKGVHFTHIYPNGKVVTKKVEIGEHLNCESLFKNFSPDDPVYYGFFPAKLEALVDGNMLLVGEYRSQQYSRQGTRREGPFTFAFEYYIVDKDLELVESGYSFLPKELQKKQVYYDYKDVNTLLTDAYYDGESSTVHVLFGVTGEGKSYSEKENGSSLYSINLSKGGYSKVISDRKMYRSTDTWADKLYLTSNNSVIRFNYKDILNVETIQLN